MAEKQAAGLNPSRLFSFPQYSRAHMEIKVLKPGYARGYTPAHRLFAPSQPDLRVIMTSAYQGRMQHIERVFDRTLEITQ